MKINDIKNELDKRNINYKGIKRKDELKELLSKKINVNIKYEEYPIQLILSDELQDIPFESIPILQNKLVYRIPSIYIMLELYKV